jgi:hypothetical protein
MDSGWCREVKIETLMYTGFASGKTTTYELKIRGSHVPNIQGDSRLKILTSGAYACGGIPSQKCHVNIGPVPDSYTFIIIII